MYTHTQEHYDPDFLQTKKNLYETKKSNLNKATAAYMMCFMILDQFTLSVLISPIYCGSVLPA